MLKVNRMKVRQDTRSHGFSLVELLVAMVVGLIIVSGAFSLHVASRKTQSVNEMQMDMVADARFAIEMIAYDLRHAGMWGGTNKNGLIDCKSTNPCTVSTTAGEALPGATIAGDCADGRYFDLSQPVFAIDDDIGSYATCIPGSESYRAGTDILEIHYADSNVTAAVDLLAGQAYIRSNFVNGRIFSGSAQPVLDSFDDSALTQNHALYSHTYYISTFTDDSADGIPSLRRVALSGSTMRNQVLVSGVEDLQVQFGEDLTGDQIVDRYVPPASVTDWSAVYSAKIWLVMRSDKPQIGVDTSKSFQVAEKPAPTVPLGGVDGFRYFMVSSVVNLRNLKQL